MDVAELEENLFMPGDAKLHGVMCGTLSAIVYRVLEVFPFIEASRPRSKSGIQTLCSLHVAVERAKNLLRHCSDCSKLYLAITGESVAARGGGRGAGDKVQEMHKESQYNPLERGNGTEGFFKVKDEINLYQGDIAASNISSNTNVTTSPNQVYLNHFNNQFYPTNMDYTFPVENGMPYMPLKMLPQAQPREIPYQEFQYFVVIDFEATCDREKNLHPQEIIEFPSVLVNGVTGQLEAYFQTYVRPVFHHLLTDFCKNLTGIQQIQVDQGVLLIDALFMHDKWLEDKGIKQKNFAVVTWSNWDCNVMLESECKLKCIRKPWYFNRWINLRVPFKDVFGGVQCNLKEAVQLAGLAWEGRQHCGLDDARNTARLLTVLMHLGFKFSITNSLTSPQPQKPKEFVMPATQFHTHSINSFSKEQLAYCYCGVLSSRCVVRKPGPTQGRCFVGCGNWTAARRAVCNYFEWTSP